MKVADSKCGSVLDVGCVRIAAGRSSRLAQPGNYQWFKCFIRLVNLATPSACNGVVDGVKARQRHR